MDAGLYHHVTSVLFILSNANTKVVIFYQVYCDRKYLTMISRQVGVQLYLTLIFLFYIRELSLHICHELPY